MSNKAEIELPAVLDISKVEALYEELEAVTTGVHDVIIKAENVERIDT